MSQLLSKIRGLCRQYRELLSYLVFGVLTTAVNYLSYLVISPFFTYTGVPTVIAWLLSVIFAYLTNRRFVFQSKARGKAVLKEAGSFFTARVMSGVMDVSIMAVFADWVGFDDRVVKLASNVLVVIFNYIASKLVVFRKK